MKYPNLSGVALVLIILCNAQISSGAPTAWVDIRVQVKGYVSGQAYLIGIHKNKKSILDSTLIDGEGNFSFQREEPLEAGAYTVLLPDSSDLYMLVDRDQNFSLSTSAGNLVGAMKVQGSLENDLLYRDLQFQLEQQTEWEAFLGQEQDREKLQQRQQAFFEARRAFLEGIFKTFPKTLFTKKTKAEQTILFLSEKYSGVSPEDRIYFFRAHFWDEVDFSDPRLLRTEVIFHHLYTYLNELTLPQTDSIRQAVDQLMEKVQNHPLYYQFFAEWIAADFQPRQSPLNDPEALYVHIVDRYMNRESAPWLDSLQVYAWQLRKEERALGLVGSQAVDITGKDPEDHTRSLFELKAPYVILYIYSPECSHCIEKTPAYVKFYKENKEKGLEVFAISKWSEEEVWKEFIERNEMNWVNVRETEEMELYKKYYIEGVPEVYLLNPSRKIIGKHLTLEDIVPLIQLDLQQAQQAALK